MENLIIYLCFYSSLVKFFPKNILSLNERKFRILKNLNEDLYLFLGIRNKHSTFEFYLNGNHTMNKTRQIKCR